MVRQIITLVTAQAADQPAAVVIALAVVSETLRRPAAPPVRRHRCTGRAPAIGSSGRADGRKPLPPDRDRSSGTSSSKASPPRTVESIDGNRVERIAKAFRPPLNRLSRSTPLDLENHAAFCCTVMPRTAQPDWHGVRNRLRVPAVTAWIRTGRYELSIGAWSGLTISSV